MENHNTIENLVCRIINESRSISSPGRPTVTQQSANSDSSFVSLEDELNRRFGIPHGQREQQQPPQRQQPQNETMNSIAGASAAVGETSQSLASLSARYNPQQNYGYSKYIRNMRRRTIRARGQSTLPYARNNQTSSSSTSSLARPTRQREEPPVLNEVILLPTPQFTKVPKYKRKSELHKRGYILDSVPIERC